MAAAPHLVSLEEYMHTSYSPDCEYIDGTVVERNVGQGKHSYTQLELGSILRASAKAMSLIVLVEQRTRVSLGRIRIPDVCVVSGLEEVTTKAPLLCVEILSPDDRWSRTNQSIRDYVDMGVPCVWVIDPYQRCGWIFDQDLPPTTIGVDGALLAQALDLTIPLNDVLPPEAS